MFLLIVLVAFRYKGSVLHDLGLPFFAPGQWYNLDYTMDGQIIKAAVHLGGDGADQTGYGREHYYNIWSLDKNFKPIPGRDKEFFSAKDRFGHSLIICHFVVLLISIKDGCLK